MAYERTFDIPDLVGKPPCKHLRSKEIYVTGNPDPIDPTEAGTHRYNCWCNKTQHVVGPGSTHYVSSDVAASDGGEGLAVHRDLGRDLRLDRSEGKGAVEGLDPHHTAPGLAPKGTGVHRQGPAQGAGDTGKKL